MLSVSLIFSKLGSRITCNTMCYQPVQNALIGLGQFQFNIFLSFLPFRFRCSLLLGYCQTDAGCLSLFALIAIASPVVSWSAFDDAILMFCGNMVEEMRGRLENSDILCMSNQSKVERQSTKVIQSNHQRERLLYNSYLQDGAEFGDILRDLSSVVFVFGDDDMPLA